MHRIITAFAALALTASAASAADLARSYVKAPVAAPIYSWTGFYVGGNVGGDWGSSHAATSTVYDPFGGYFANTSVPAIGAVGLQKISKSNVTGGFTAGYNWQTSNVLFGLEGDINYLGFKGSATGSAVYPCCAPTSFTVNSSVSADWLATIRGRLGVVATPNWLLYVTGGAAIAEVRGNFRFSDTFATAAESASFVKPALAGPSVLAANMRSATAGRSRPSISMSISVGALSPATT